MERANKEKNKNLLNPKVDLYLTEGCGRCHLAGTPGCKVHEWPEELELLRSIVLDTGLTEELKWGMPCYTYEGRNIVIVSAFRNYCSVNFFKGSLLKDTAGMLVSPGENSQSTKLLKFTNIHDIKKAEKVIRSYILEAIELEKEGKKVNFKKETEPIPAELLQKFEDTPGLKQAFYALTTGRQRGYILYFTSAKQASTRLARIEKYTDQIMSGKGLNDR